jgi:sulfite reductase (NADPH) hemoprotein beta-component
MPEVIARLLQVYVRERYDDERFIDTYRRLGIDPYKAEVYGTPVEAEEELRGSGYGLVGDVTPYATPYYSPRF